MSSVNKIEMVVNGSIPVTLTRKVGWVWRIDYSVNGEEYTCYENITTDDYSYLVEYVEKFVNTQVELETEKHTEITVDGKTVNIVYEDGVWKICWAYKGIRFRVDVITEKGIGYVVAQATELVRRNG